MRCDGDHKKAHFNPPIAILFLLARNALWLTFARRLTSLYEAFPAVEARRPVERFEWHYTPKHGSWLDLAESELGVLTSQCLNRRIPNKQILIEEIAAWEHDRNANHTKADWHMRSTNGSSSHG